jgi:hypothetical protein
MNGARSRIDAVFPGSWRDFPATGLSVVLINYFGLNARFALFCSALPFFLET